MPVQSPTGNVIQTVQGIRRSPWSSSVTSITSETIFLGNNLSTKENLISLFFGSKLANKNLPAVDVYFSNF